MLKKLIFIVLIIILVFINWFNKGFAQTTEELIDKYESDMKRRQQTGNSLLSRSYQTPPIYQEGELVNDSLLALHRRQVSDSLAFGESIANDSGMAVYENWQTSDTVQEHQLVLPDSKKIIRFGQNLFENRHVSEINTSQVPDDYLLGPGDNLIISLWGRVQQEWNITVDRQGKIFIPKVGEIWRYMC